MRVDRYTVAGLRSDIKSVKDNVKFVADRLNDTQEPFRRQMNSFVKVTVTSLCTLLGNSQLLLCQSSELGLPSRAMSCFTLFAPIFYGRMLGLCIQ